MDNNERKIEHLFEKLRVLMQKHQAFSTEIKALRDEIYALQKKGISTSDTGIKEEPVIKQTLTPVVGKDSPDELKKQEIPVSFQKAKQPKPSKPKSKTDFEKFIGENLINKIGIAITVIGVAIGAKYSIENELISPLTRIILGYLSGLALMGFGIKLKQKYESYSAVLVSGAIAIMYLMTYMAYDFYGLIPQAFAFALMLLFTAFTVFAAIQYKKQVIAHIGLVGAYAVPFLLSNNSGNVTVLFAYMCIINIGILLISARQYWKPLFYSSFFFTWTIFIGWFSTDYDRDAHFTLALIFLTLFFLIFYATFLVYKLIKKEKFAAPDVILMLLNSFIFFGLGMALLGDNKDTDHLLGVFTVINAIIHAAVSALIYKLKLADRKLLYLIAGLVMVFITTAVPVQLNGNWITFIWLGEAVLLYTLGKTKNIDLYEKLSYPILVLVVISLLGDWNNGYSRYYYDESLTPFLNIYFLTSILVAAGFGFVNYLSSKKELPSAIIEKKSLNKIVQFLLPTVFLSVLYFSFYLEIDNYWSELFTSTKISIPQENGYDNTYYNYDLFSFKTVWLINYTLLFFSILSFVNIKKLKEHRLSYVNIVLNILAIGMFLALGLYELSELRHSYLVPSDNDYFNHDFFNLVIRYISYVFVALCLFATSQYVKQELIINTKLKPAFEIFLAGTILWILSSELFHWMDIAEYDGTYKLGFSILCGIYSLALVSFGIWKNKQHLRIAAMVTFGATIIKLFAYDISHLNTIAKIIVLVSLGVLLLIFSFLYNKFKNDINNEAE